MLTGLRGLGRPVGALPPPAASGRLRRVLAGRRLRPLPPAPLPRRLRPGQAPPPGPIVRAAAAPGRRRLPAEPRALRPDAAAGARPLPRRLPGRGGTGRRRPRSPLGPRGGRRALAAAAVVRRQALALGRGLGARGRRRGAAAGAAGPEERSLPVRHLGAAAAAAPLPPGAARSSAAATAPSPPAPRERFNPGT